MDLIRLRFRQCVECDGLPAASSSLTAATTFSLTARHDQAPEVETMLPGLIEVDNFDSSGESLGGQVPDPTRTVADDDQLPGARR